MDGVLCSPSLFMVLTLPPAKMFVQKKLRGELARDIVWQRLPSGRFLCFEFFVSFCVHSWLSFHDEIVAVVHFARPGRERAANLRFNQTGAVRCRRAQVSAFVADWLRVDAVGHGVVCVERERRTECGFLGFYTVYDGRFYGGGNFGVHFCAGLSGRARPGRPDVVAGEIDGGYRAFASGRIAICAGDSNLGIPSRRRGRLVHRDAVETARHFELGDGDGRPHPHRQHHPSGVRGIRADSWSDRVSRDVSAIKPRILVIRGGAIGDFILTLPVIAALRRQFPQAHLEVLGYPHIAQLAVAGGLADRVQPIEARGLAGFFARGGTLEPDLMDYFSEFDLVISYLYDPDEIFKTNVGRCLVKQFIVGPHRPDEADRIHATQVYLKPLERLAIFDADPVPRLSFNPQLSTLNQLALHPGSGSEKKNWPETKWAGLIQQIMATTNWDLLLVGGEAEGERLRRLAAVLPPARGSIAQGLPPAHTGQ